METTIMGYIGVILGRKKLSSETRASGFGSTKLLGTKVSMTGDDAIPWSPQNLWFRV